MAFDKWKQMATDLGSKVAAGASDTFKDLADKAPDAAAKAAETAGKVGQQAGEKFSEWSESAAPTAAKAGEQIKKVGVGAQETLSKAAGKASETAKNLSTPASGAAEVKVERADAPAAAPAPKAPSE